MLLVESVYRSSAALPGHEKFGLCAQIRRSAVSAPSNIAEGAACGSTMKFLGFLGIARGSLSELDPQIQMARRLGFLSAEPDFDQLLDRTLAKLGGLIRALKSKTRDES